jgi:hypothetical protein
MIFLVLETLILSRFIEEHHSPFSYPSDPAIYVENATLKTASDENNRRREKELANKWRFAEELRKESKLCKYQIRFTRNAASVVDFWNLQLQTGGWEGNAVGPLPDGSMQPGMMVRTSENSGAGLQCLLGPCKERLQIFYPNPPSKIATNQLTDFLSSCGHDCVQIEINY